MFKGLLLLASLLSLTQALAEPFVSGHPLAGGLYGPPPNVGATGPASAVDGQIVLFDGITGDLLKAGTGTGLVKATSGVVTFASLVNADVSASAAIDYSKLNLATSITNADIATNAAIAYSKLNLGLSIVNADISASAALARSKIAAGTASRVLVNDGSGLLSESSVTSTTLGYLDIGSSLTTLLAAKAPLASPSFTGQVVIGESSSSAPFLIKSLTGNSNGIKIWSDSVTDAAYLYNHYGASFFIGSNNASILELTTGGGTKLLNLTASTVPYLDASKVLTSSAVTPTELGYLSGVTSAVQTQLGGKVNDTGDTMTGALQITVGDNLPLGLTGSSSAGSIRFINTAASGKYNWIVGGQYNVNNGFEITPSTATDGSTFSAPVFQVTNAGLFVFGASGGTAVNTMYARAMDLQSSNSGVTNYLQVQNTSNTANSDAQLAAIIGGASGGNAFTLYSGAGNAWYSGMHNSDSDSYKISVGGFGAGADWLKIATTGAITMGGDVTIATSAGPMLTIKDGGTSGVNADPYLRFMDTSTEMGYLGFPVSNAENLYITNKKNGSLIFQADNTTIASVAGSDGHWIFGRDSSSGVYVNNGLRLNHSAVSAREVTVTTGVSNGGLSIGGDTAVTAGGSIRLYGASHASAPSETRFYNANALTGYVDVNGAWDLGIAGQTILLRGITTARRDQNGRTRFFVRNDNAGSSATAEAVLVTDAGDVNIYGTSLASGASAVIAADGTYTGGTIINQLGSNPIALRTNSTDRITIAGTGLVTITGNLAVNGVITGGFAEVDDGNSSTADTIDWSTGSAHKSTLTGNVTYTFTAPSQAGTPLVLRVLTGAGSYTATWPATVKWASGTAPTITTTASRMDLINFYWDGTSYYGSYSQNYTP